MHFSVRLLSSETSAKKSYGLIDFVDSKSVRRAFGSKTFVKGKHVKVALSRFAAEVRSQSYDHELQRQRWKNLQRD
jgi:hypothetical protein